MGDVSDKVINLMYEGVESVYRPSKYKLETDFPRHYTVGVIDIDFGPYASDLWFEISYDDPKQMQSAITRAVRKIFTAEVLEYYASGKIKNLTL